jgi:hypothetical protein
VRELLRGAQDCRELHFESYKRSGKTYREESTGMQRSGHTTDGRTFEIRQRLKLMMTPDDAQRWQEFLANYSYPVSGVGAILFGARYRLAERWFNFELKLGDRDETMRLEARFREFGPRFIEAWYEVIFWKLASTGRRGEYFAAQMVEKLRKANHRASEIWAACANFVDSGTRSTFKDLQFQLSITSAIPVAATFPAFVRPDRFPMVDRWVATWVIKYREAYRNRSAGLAGPSESYLRGNRTTLMVSGDWESYVEWIEWSRAAAQILTERTGFPWRARDVEMAAFTNARTNSPILPKIA